jgi:DNA excision repair protein ERCC-2
MKAEIKITVRTLVDHVLRCGDLQFEFLSAGRAVDGIRGHQIVQRSRPQNYLAEVPISQRIETERFILVVSGRIDGVLAANGQVTIEEIKTTSGDLETLAAKQSPYHWGQLTAYAYLYASTHRLEALDLHLTYYQLDSGALKTCRRRHTFMELELFFNDLVKRYLSWAETLVGWQAQRDESIRSLTFPFANYRHGQRQIAVAAYRAIRDHGQLMIQAPTGIGKTLAVIFPALKSMAEGHVQKLFYLTARTTGQIAAEDTFSRLRQKGLHCRTLTLTAKDKICFNPASTCSPDECEFARGYYDRLNAALQDALDQQALSRPVVEALARHFKICPFEFSLELSLWVDAVICDYNYAFDPRVYLRRFFADESAPMLLLIDEAHNLVDRSREMFSAEITKAPFLDLRRTVKQELPAVYKILGKINAWLVKARRNKGLAPDHGAEKDPPTDLLPLLRGFVHLSEKWLRANPASAFREALLKLYFSCSGFLKVAEVYDCSYATCYTRIEKDLKVKLFCIDPSGQLATALKRGVASIFFSATMTPVTYFQKMFGCPDHAGRLSLPSPFPLENLGIFLSDQISTYYSQRHATKLSIARSLVAFTSPKRGNYLFFFPSYQYLQMVHELYVEQLPAARIIVQRPEMTEAQRADFLGHFYEEQVQSLVGFAVLGGIFGEGIDLLGERLSGAAIVGVGLPGVCAERELIREYYEKMERCGFAFAYQFPGLNRVLQAAGRVIRSETDRGVVLLIDQRFSHPRYQSLLPRHWRPTRVASAQQLETLLEKFWKLR